MLENDDLSNLSKLQKAVIDGYKAGINELETSYFGKITHYKEGDIILKQFYDKNGFHIKIDTPFNYVKDPVYYVYFQLASYNDDFKEVFNIGTLPAENNMKLYKISKPFHITHFETQLTFNNLWDRCPFKVYSSIAEQSLHQYIGLSNVYYTPIKYYKLRSTDQKFWIELNSANRDNYPIRLPARESFCIEMQFLPFNKMM